MEEASCAQNTAWEVSDSTNEILPGKGSEGRRAEKAHTAEEAVTAKAESTPPNPPNPHPPPWRLSAVRCPLPLNAGSSLIVPNPASQELAGLCSPDCNYGNQASVPFWPRGGTSPVAGVGGCCAPRSLLHAPRFLSRSDRWTDRRTETLILERHT